jgi:hypothetical protein
VHTHVHTRASALQLKASTSLEWGCLGHVVRVARGAASDIRLNIRLFKACAADWKRFCDDVEPGHMRVQECLEDHIEDSGFSHGCRTALKDVIAARVADFRCARARVCVCGGGMCAWASTAVWVCAACMCGCARRAGAHAAQDHARPARGHGTPPLPTHTHTSLSVP